MNKSRVHVYALGILSIGMLAVSAAFFLGKIFVKVQPMASSINCIADVISLFPTTAHQIEQRLQEGLAQTKTSLAELVAIPIEKKSFANTMLAYDYIVSRSPFVVTAHALNVLELVSSDKEIRQAAHAAIITIQEFAVDNISNNVAVYNALKAYAENNGKNENLTQEERYFVEKTLEDFKREGLDLPAHELEHVRTLNKELAALSLEFETNIATDASTIEVTYTDLHGVDESFIKALKKTDQGLYILGVDYPTYHEVMDNCSVADTRLRMNRAFVNRAYPKNDSLLENVIAKRSELAQLLGFPSYAALDIDDQMAKTPERAQKFLQDLHAKAQIKATKEFELLLTDLPESVHLTADKKFNPWDLSYAYEQFKKKHFAVDEQEISQYFPMEKTVDGLLDIYQKFLNVTFVKVPVHNLWHSEVTAIEVRQAENNVLYGYILLDLYPRPNKFSHACQSGVVAAIQERDGTIKPSVTVVIANFPRSTQERPALLKFKDVETFFHEFGHAMHHVLGQTELGSTSGTSVKQDFVEMPSQIFEEWLWDTHILAQVSSHYQTGKPLPKKLIDTMIALKNFSTGNEVESQIFYALLSLEYYGAGAHKDLFKILKKTYTRVREHIAFDDHNHMYAAFGHLMDYGAKYYGYLWSKVFALDVFDIIKHEGLLNGKTGQRYIQQVIGRGGSAEPEELLKTFLGREPNQQAFLKDLGL